MTKRKEFKTTKDILTREDYLICHEKYAKLFEAGKISDDEYEKRSNLMIERGKELGIETTFPIVG